MDIIQIFSTDELAEMAHTSLAALDPDRIARAPISDDEFENLTIDLLGKQMSDLFRAFPIVGGGKIPKEAYWARLKEEIHLLICTDDKRYAALRKKIAVGGGKSQTAIVGVIAAAIASNIGLLEGAVTPFVALMLIGVLEVGKNAFCAGAELNMKVPKSKKGKKAKDQD